MALPPSFPLLPQSFFVHFTASSGAILCGLENPLSQEIEAGAAVLGSFDEPCDGG